MRFTSVGRALLRSLVVALALVAGSQFAGSRASATRTPLCGKAHGARYTHVIWIWMENTSFESVIGNPQAPFINSLAQTCGLATRYFGVTHPSLPNYIAATSGDTHGIGDDDPPAAHPLTGPSIYSELTLVGKTWREYEEDAPGTCPQSSTGTYATKHDPAVYYVGVRKQCLLWDVPLGTPGKGPLHDALAGDRLPSFAFVTPNLCNDMHDCSLATGDAWLRAWVTQIGSSSTYLSGRLAVFVVWDESDSTNHVPLIAVAPSIRNGARIGARLDHYSLLKTTEQLLGLRLLGTAAASTTTSFRAALEPTGR